MTLNTWNSIPLPSFPGASSGIGRAAALLLARNNYKLSLTGRNVAALNELAGQIVSAGSDKNDVLVTAVELASEEAPKTIVDATVQKFGRIDTLVGGYFWKVIIKFRTITGT